MRPWIAGCVALIGLSACAENGAHSLAVGAMEACRLAPDGRVQCWGRTQGFAGASRELDYVWPATELSGAVVHLAVGQEHQCAALDTGAVECWGAGNDGRKGFTKIHTGGQHILTAVNSAFVRVAAGRHTCAVTVDGDVWCWGPNYLGALGLGHREAIGDDEDPASAGPVDLDGRAKDIVVGTSHSCALLIDGRVRCWGDNIGVAREGCTAPWTCDAHPACCAGDDEPASAIPLVDLPAPARALAAGPSTTCALLDDGSVHCWGALARPGLARDAPPTPTSPVDVGGPAIAIAVGTRHACVVLERGTLRCWGSNEYGQLGLGHSEDLGDDELPAEQPEVDVGGPAVAAGVASSHTCAMLEGGDVRCWGYGPGTLTGRDRDAVGCTVVEPNPNAGSICEPATIKTFHCSVGEHCCIGDDEPPIAIPLVPLE